MSAHYTSSSSSSPPLAFTFVWSGSNVTVIVVSMLLAMWFSWWIVRYCMYCIGVWRYKAGTVRQDIAAASQHVAHAAQSVYGDNDDIDTRDMPYYDEYINNNGGCGDDIGQELYPDDAYINDDYRDTFDGPRQRHCAPSSSSSSSAYHDGY